MQDIWYERHTRPSTPAVAEVHIDYTDSTRDFAVVFGNYGVGRKFKKTYANKDVAIATVVAKKYE
jgi:hypothetical protein